MAIFTASAPGKVHLFGEHSVVYGHTAVLAAIHLRSKVQVNNQCEWVQYQDQRFGGKEFKSNPRHLIAVAQEAEQLWEKGHKSGDFQPLFAFLRQDHYQVHQQASLGLVMLRLNISHGFSMEVYSEIPTGRGLGSSASASVALVHALSAAFGKKLSLEEINQLAFEQERMAHGRPSGGDNACCCYGGILTFRRREEGPEITPLERRSGAEDLWKSFFLVDMGAPRKSTGELVQSVRLLPMQQRDTHLNSLGEIADQALKKLHQSTDQLIDSYCELMNQAQKHLSSLGVSTPEMDQLAREVEETGGGAKLSGAGGGGMLLCLHPDPSTLEKLLSQQKLPFFAVKMGSAGSGLSLQET